MFGLTIKEKLYNIILNTSQNYIDSYANDLLDEFHRSNGQESPTDEFIFTARKNYLDKVANQVISIFSSSTPRVYTRILSCLVNPSACGYDFDVDRGIMAGGVYAMCYYANTGKIAKPSECIKLNHLQNDIMNEALNNLQNYIMNETSNNLRNYIMNKVSNNLDDTNINEKD